MVFIERIRGYYLFNRMEHINNPNKAVEPIRYTLRVPLLAHG
jgi:hypothetical protein